MRPRLGLVDARDAGKLKRVLRCQGARAGRSSMFSGAELGEAVSPPRPLEDLGFIFVDESRLLVRTARVYARGNPNINRYFWG